MSEHIINHSALSYLNQWYVTDRHYMGISTSADTTTTTAGSRLQDLGAEYGVARNFALPGMEKDGRKREASILWEEISSLVSDAASESAVKANETVAVLADKLGKVFPGKKSGSPPALLSAATKFLWFSGRYDIRIYDKRAVHALNSWCEKNRDPSSTKKGWRIDGSYAAFSKEWHRMYQTHESAIRDAVADLKNVGKWSLVPEATARTAMQTVLPQQWFLDRVFDKYLWTIGAKKKRV
ncbi:hypothetical protein RA224_20660 [Achromobacter aegrifaciens]|uniref:hypothetical protein n=1 Tax=Achromobacter aegrifaciens TaxID=1287736 RepID=UPI0027B9EFBA|nr:hypothetical protein [Achromobacter aegrifaciens]WLW59637.1 hypothetical protein RA224_20660 [Achromobacter aegrifaciens]